MLNRARLRRASWLLMGTVFVVALAYGATDSRGPQSDAERSSALAGTIACPQCSGQPVSDSNAPIAALIRAEIKQQVDAGLTDSEIRAVYTARYGEWVDLNPSRRGLTGAVWIAPFLVIGMAVGVLALAFSRWHGTGETHRASAADIALVGAAKDDLDSQLP